MFDLSLSIPPSLLLPSLPPSSSLSLPPFPPFSPSLPSSLLPPLSLSSSSLPPSLPSLPPLSLPPLSLSSLRQLNQSYIDELGIHYLPGWKDPWGERPMTFGEIGCFLSHHTIWERVSTL